MLPSMHCTDRTLVFDAQAGSRAAFNVLVIRYRPRILKLTLRHVRNPADAEDIVQDIFIKAFAALALFRGDCAFYSWLHRIAINSAINFTRLRSREVALFAAELWIHQDADDGVGRHLDTPEAIALTGEIGAAVNAAIDGLADEQKKAIVLREFNGLSYQQVAAAMACPVGTVRSRVFRAREIIDHRVRRVFDEGIGRRRSPQAAPLT